MSNEIYKRALIDHIKKWLDRPEIIVITGSRQIGKTFLTRQILPQITTLPIHYINFEDFEMRELFDKKPKEFIDSIFDKNKIYIFDEFQKVPKLINMLKVKYDEDKQNFPKIFLTGSSSISIQENVSQSLVGQSIIFNLYSLSFAERFNLSSQDILTNISEQNILEWKKDVFFHQKLRQNFNQYLLEGGYPELGELEPQRRSEKLQSITQTILEKDLQSLVKAEHLFSAKKLLEIMSFRIGNIVSFENLASEMQLNIKTVRNLIAIFEGLFFVEMVYPKAQFGNEYKKAPKIYFHDLGIRNELIKMRELPVDKSMLGGLVENFIFCQLRRYCSYQQDFKLNYWQDYNGNEVDFVLSQNNSLISIEVKYQKNYQGKISLGVANFIKKYRPQYHITITEDSFGSQQLENCQVFFIPAYYFGLLI
jgi:predicted AAA+ superfamily ATPase